MEIIGLFLFIAGFIIGLGAVTVIDLHGFMGRRSTYWTEATTRTHKITKPLIWMGTILAIIGGIIFYQNPEMKFAMWHSIIAVILVINGLFLSFSVSPFLLQREKEGRASEILPAVWQKKITVSFIVSFIGWWCAVLLLVIQLV